MAALVAGEPLEDLEPLPEHVTFRTLNARIILMAGHRVKFRGGLFATDDPDLVEALRCRPDVEEVAC
jgi:hypothetical protein